MEIIVKRSAVNKKLIGALSVFTFISGMCYASNINAALTHSTAVVKIGQYKVGEEGTLWVGFKVDKGFKWNKKFNSKIGLLKEPELIKPPITVYKNEDFYVQDNMVLVLLKIVPITSGQERLKIILRFSVCNDVTCYIESVRFDIDINIRG